MESSRKRLHSSSYEYLGGGLQPQVLSQQKPLESTAVEAIMNNICLNLNFFESQQRVKILDELIMRIVLVKVDVVGLSTTSTNAPPPSQPPPPKLVANSSPRLPPTTTTTNTIAQSLTDQQFSEFQQNFLRQQLYSNVQYLPQYSQYQRVVPSEPKIDPLVKFHQLLEENAAANRAKGNGTGNGTSSSSSSLESSVYPPRMMAPPRIAPTPIPAPPILTPQVAKPDVKKPFLLNKVRPCNQWSVVSLPLPLAS